MKNSIVLLLVLVGFISCNSHNNKLAGDMPEVYQENEVVPTRMAESTPSMAQTQDKIQVIEKKIIKDAEIGIEVSDYKIVKNKVDSIVRSLNGYISNDNLYNNDESINCNMVIRMPEKNFEKFLTFLEKGGDRVKYKNISARDITEEFIDIEARLKNKLAVEKRYAQLLAKALSVKDILEIEEKLRIIREEIESTQGRLNYLSSQVSYSTINLMLEQKLEYKYQPSKGKNFFQLLIRSLDKGWNVFLQFLLFVFKLWPFIILIIAIIIAYYKFWKPKKDKKHKKDK